MDDDFVLLLLSSALSSQDLISFRITETSLLALISWTWYKQKILVVQVVAILLGAAGVLMVYERDIRTQNNTTNITDCANCSDEITGNSTTDRCFDETVGIIKIDLSGFLLGVFLTIVAALTEVGK